MLDQSTSKQDLSSSLTTEARSRAPWRVSEVKALEDFRLTVRFADGTEGTVDVAGLVRSPRAGVFARLADPQLFLQVYVEQGVVTWPGELDLAPDALYTEIKQWGEWKVR